eukprot:366279-Chlamydomonas_euryale.AAC.7
MHGCKDGPTRASMLACTNAGSHMLCTFACVHAHSSAPRMTEHTRNPDAIRRPRGDAVAVVIAGQAAGAARRCGTAEVRALAAAGMTPRPAPLNNAAAAVAARKVTAPPAPPAGRRPAVSTAQRASRRDDDASMLPDVASF